jgi:4-hydroxybenzoate polyprenyltransferase
MAMAASDPSARPRPHSIAAGVEGPPDRSVLKAVILSLRPHQWTKNLFVLAALAFSKHLFDVGYAVKAGLAFAVFCAISGVVYVINDVVDLERDRLHPRKRLRPIASGQLSPRAAVVLALGLAGVALSVAFAMPLGFAVCACAYLGLNLLYSFRLKNVVILDVLALSLGFVLRAVAGALAIEVVISEWLVICTLLVALFLALAKRRAELTSLEGAAVDHRKILAEYSPYLLDQMISVVTASCVTAYAFYTTAQETREKFHTHRLSWTLPFVLYGIFRYLYLVHQREQGGSPSETLLNDRPILVAVLLWAIAVVLILYAPAGAPALGH